MSPRGAPRVDDSPLKPARAELPSRQSAAVGAERTLHVDVRIVAVTRRDLPAMVADGRFREDLWYRLAVFPVPIRPLRERQDDIADLAGHFARRHQTKREAHCTYCVSIRAL